MFVLSGVGNSLAMGWFPRQRSSTGCLKITKLKWSKASHECLCFKMGATGKREREGEVFNIHLYQQISSAEKIINYILTSHRKGPALIPGEVVWDLWWTKWLRTHLTSGAGKIGQFFLILVCEAIDTAAIPGLLCQPRVIVKMIVEKQVECRLARGTEVLGENLPQRHFCPSQIKVIDNISVHPLHRQHPLHASLAELIQMKYIH
jgi:hypothetical protein